jgi:quercetin dioxygenase-like cupin family protein
MITDTLKLAKKNFASPDAVRECDHGRLEVLTVEDATVTRITLQPGWKWSEHARPILNTESWQAQHQEYVVRGRLHIRQDDGRELDLEAGDFAVIPSGHDAWVEGNEPVVCIDFSPDMKQYAQGGK